MKTSALTLTVLAATLLIAPAGAQDPVNPAGKEQIQKPTKKVKELQTERLAALRQLAAVVTAAYQHARMDYGEVIEARIQLLKAELEVAGKESDRIALYKKLVDEWKQSEDVAKSRWEATRASVVPYLRFKAMRLEAEIRLQQAQAKQSGVERRKIMVTTPLVKNVDVTQRYVCQIHSHRHIKIRALQKGYLEKVPVREGQTVKRGDVIFKVVPVTYQAKLDAELAETRLAELELKNTEKLFKNKGVAQNEVELYQAKLQRARAKAQFAMAELRFTEVRAPFDGIIDRLYEQQGSLVTERDVLTTLSDNSLVWVYFNVPESRYLEYMAVPAKDREAKIELVLANGKKFKPSGKISAIEAQFNNANGQIPFRADFPNPDGLLRHGMTGTVLVHQTITNAIVIPQRATFEILDKRYVYVIDKDGVAHQREIVVRAELDDGFVIARGVGADDKIVFAGIRQVRDGEKVR